MITLCMDTSHVWLAAALIRDGELLAGIQKECWKRQSEELIPTLDGMLKGAGLKPADIDRIVITEGPGSYTGVRIAMTAAKVFCALRNIPLYTISTLDLYAGNDTCRVIMDARGKRVYTAAYEDGRIIELQSVRTVEELQEADENLPVIGDGRLIGKADCVPDIPAKFLQTEKRWKKAENVHLVVPEYLKPSEAYLIKK